MALYVWQRSITDRNGVVRPFASIEVKDAITGVLVQLYEDIDGEDALGNPFAADEEGFARFYARTGRYRITATYGSDSRIWENERLGTTGDEIVNLRTPSEIAAGVTPTNYAYPELHVLRYGNTLDAAHLQAAINFWIARGYGTLDLAGQTFGIGTTEIEIEFPTNIRTMVLEGNGAVIAASGDIDAGNGAALKIFRASGATVRNKIFRNLTVKPTSGNSIGIEIDGLGGSGFLYRCKFDSVIVESVTRHGWKVGGKFFESEWNECNVDIATNESGYHCVRLDSTGNDAGSGDLSSLEFNSCTMSGGENNIYVDDAGDPCKINGGTFVLSGKEAIKGSASGNLEFEVINAHFENAWAGSSAVKSASWVSSTNQSAVNFVGRGTVQNCYFVSSTDAVRQAVRVSAVGAVKLSGLRCLENGSGDFAYMVRAQGSSAGKILIESCENMGSNGVAVVDDYDSANVNYEVIACPDVANYQSVKTFGSADATPSVLGGNIFRTNTSALTITDFDDGHDGQQITVISKGAITFDTTGTDLTGSSVDLVTASGDITRWVNDGGATWRLVAFVDASVDNSGGA